MIIKKIDLNFDNKRIDYCYFCEQQTIHYFDFTFNVWKCRRCKKVLEDNNYEKEIINSNKRRVRL